MFMNLTMGSTVAFLAVIFLPSRKIHTLRCLRPPVWESQDWAMMDFAVKLSYFVSLGLTSKNVSDIGMATLPTNATLHPNNGRLDVMLDFLIGRGSQNDFY
jgi:hypothetical protein